MFQFETVEARRLLAGEITQLESSAVDVKLSKTGVLTVTGTGGADNIKIEQVGNENRLRVTNAGGVRYLASYGRTGNTFDLSLVKKIVVQANAGKDYVKVATTQKRITAVVEGGGGNDTLVADMRGATLRGGAGDDYLTSGSEVLAYSVRFIAGSPFAGTWYQYDASAAPARPIVTATSLTSPYAYEYRAGTPLVTNPYRLNATANVLEGGSGDDRLSTRGGEDSLYGGDGNDTVIKRNELVTYLSALPAIDGTDDIPSRAAIFGVEVILGTEQALTDVVVRRSSL